MGLPPAKPDEVSGTRRHTMSILLRFRPNTYFAVLVYFNVYDIRPTTYRAVLNVDLARARRQVEWHYDFLATRITNVGSFVIHRGHRKKSKIPGNASESC